MTQEVRRDNVAWWLLLLVGSIAGWMSFGRLHYVHTADSILPVVISLQHWTPFFWGQDRFGMLVPLLAMPFHNPLTNLLVQGWLTTGAALLAPFVVARYLGGGPSWFATGALANAFLLLVFSDRFQFDWFVAQPYALSITIAVTGLLVLEGTGLARAAMAAALMLLAHWVNVGVCVVVVPCVLVRARSMVRSLSVTGIGLAGGLLLQHVSTAPATRTELAPVSEWPRAWFMLLHTTAGTVAHPRWLVVFVALAALGAAVLWITGRLVKPARAAMMALVVAGVYWLVVGTFLHVQLNDSMPRYVLPSVLLLGVSMAIISVAALGHRPRVVATMATLALIAGSVVGYGAPSVTRLRRTIDRSFGVLTPEIMSSGATVLAGDYWTVWPTVFHTNLVLYEQARPNRVFGLTYRSDATDPLWSTGSKAKPVVLVAPRSDTSVGSLVARIGVPVTFVGYGGSLAIFVLGTGTSQTFVDQIRHH